MGLFSATAIVMGSMIGSGIFIVSADMSRTLSSPALLIAAWLVTAVMTIIGALSYGELAAMMPQAGGQYVYLREALGPIWGFLYGWTLFLVIQTGTIAAVGVAFGKFLGVFFPSVSKSNWIWHVGSGEVGLNTANLAAILLITLLTVVNTFGVKLGALVQNVFTTAKVLCAAGRRLRRPHRQKRRRHRRQLLQRRTSGPTPPAPTPSTSAPSSRSAAAPPSSAPSPSSPSCRSARSSPPTPGTTSPSPPAKSATPNRTCRSRSPSAPASSCCSTSLATSST